MINRDSANSILTKALAITNVGDYISSLAYGIILSELNQNFLYAGLIWPIRSIAQAFGSALTPTVLRMRHTNQLLALTQLIMALLTLLMCLLLFVVKDSRLLSFLILISWISLSLFSQIFMNLREIYSKELDKFIKPEDGEKAKVSRAMQIKMELGQFFGQFAGPILFLVIAYGLKWHLGFALLVDAISFILAWKVLSKLPSISTHAEQSDYLKVLNLIYSNSKLLSIFIVRSVVFWISMGLFNLILVPLPVSQMGLDLRLSPVLYTLIGFGGILFTQAFEKLRINNRIHELLHNQSNTTLAILGTTIYSLAILLFAASSNWFGLSLSLVLIGFGNGFQRISTRAIVREFCSEDEIKNVFGLEFFIGRLTDFAFSMFFAGALFSGKPIHWAAYFAAFFVLLTIPFFLFIKQNREVPSYVSTIKRTK